MCVCVCALYIFPDWYIDAIIRLLKQKFSTLPLVELPLQLYYINK